MTLVPIFEPINVRQRMDCLCSYPIKGPHYNIELDGIMRSGDGRLIELFFSVPDWLSPTMPVLLSRST